VLYQMNPLLLQSKPNLTWHVFVESLENKQVEAWVAEFPECRVVEDSQEGAIAVLEDLLNQRMAKIKVLPLQLSVGNSENSWIKIWGSLKDNVSFWEWSDRFWTEKQQSREDDEVLSVEECMRVM
jgi:hypothetical protein